MKKNPQLALTLILGSLFLGLAFNFFFMWQVPGVSLVLYTLLIIGFVQLVKMQRNGKWYAHASEIIYLPILFVAVVPFLSQNYTLSTLSVLLTLVSTVYVTIMVLWDIKPALFSFLEMIVLGFFHQIIQIGYFFKPFTELTGVSVKKSTASNYSNIALKVLAGIVLALPLLLCFFILFISADTAFDKVFAVNFEELYKFFSWERVWELFVWISVSVWLLGGFSAAVYYQFRRGETTLNTRFLDPIVATVISVMVNLLFLCFVIIQFVYLFAGEARIGELGLTYSEYARQGFFELLAVAAISLIVVYGLRRFGSFRSALNNTVLQFSLILQVLFNLVVLYSAYYRMSLYEKAYALTDVRFFVYAFLFFLVAVFAYVIAAILSKQALQYFSLATFVMACVLMFTMGLVNPDAYVAKTNIAKQAAGQTQVGQLDTNYLINALSSDAYVHLLAVATYRQDPDIMCDITRAWLEESSHRGSFQALNLYRLSNSETLTNATKDYIVNGDLSREKCDIMPIRF
jgi:hypothetical protein